MKFKATKPNYSLQISSPTPYISSITLKNHLYLSTILENTMRCKHMQELDSISAFEPITKHLPYCAIVTENPGINLVTSM